MLWQPADALREAGRERGREGASERGRDRRERRKEVAVPKIDYVKDDHSLEKKKVMLLCLCLCCKRSAVTIATNLGQTLFRVFFFPHSVDNETYSAVLLV